jgi:hypothetical protein
MFIRQNREDGAYLITMEHRARCAGACGEWLRPGDLAWSYMAAPVDGNYVECGLCRYGEEPRVEAAPDRPRANAHEIAWHLARAEAAQAKGEPYYAAF